jgi:hypothetical protein
MGGSVFPFDGDIDMNDGTILTKPMALDSISSFRLRESLPSGRGEPSSGWMG